MAAGQPVPHGFGHGVRFVPHGASGDPEYGVKGLLVRNLEHLSPPQFAKVMGTLGADLHGQQILAAWIGKENCATR